MHHAPVADAAQDNEQRQHERQVIEPQVAHALQVGGLGGQQAHDGHIDPPRAGERA